jgi:hypothetical protein
VVVVRRALPAVLALAAACEPSLDQRTFSVTSARVLAVRSDPAEALPGATVALSSLYVDESGAIAPGAASFDWAFCEDRNPLANLEPVSPACSERTGGTFIELGRAASASAPLPTTACRLFGPDVPSAQPNQPPGRPVDADTTGGYYQPVRLAAGDQIAVGLVRITCGVPGATPEQTADLTKYDHSNTNPELDAVSTQEKAGVPGAPLVLEAAGANPVARSQRLELRASWAGCDPLATGCTGSEGYAFLDPQSHTVTRAREQMRVSWFSTGGTFDDDRTGRDATDPTLYTDNGWTAPATAGQVYVWVVLRDDRGGVGWRSYVMDVK